MKPNLDYLKYLGVPYEFGGNSLMGLDCINLCTLMAKDRGVPMMNVNHTHTNMHTYHYLFNLRDSKDKFSTVPKQGNVLVVFKIKGKVSHVGYMLDANNFIHIMEGSRVSVEKINITWENRLVGFYKYVGGEDEST